MLNEKELTRLLGFANGYPNVLGDIGNALCKLGTDKPVVRGNNPMAEVYFPHAIAELTEAQYNRLLHYQRGKRAFHLFRWMLKDGDRFFVTGEEAYSVNPGFEPLRGRAKYSKDNYGVLFMTGVVRLFDGNPLEVINAFVAHPPADLDYVPELLQSVVGKWRFECNGEKHVVKVAYANAFDEIVGGVWNATVGVDGRLIDDMQIIGDGPTLAFDMGGGSIDLARLNKDGSIDYNTEMVSVRTGVNTAIDNFKGLFEQEYRELLDDSEDGISRSEIIDIFLDPDHSIRSVGETLDCTELYNLAVAPVIRQSVAAVRSFTRGKARYNRVLLTGGGCGLTFDKLAEVVFPKFSENNVIHLADHKRELFKANGRGAKKMLPGLISESEKMVTRMRKGR